MLLTAAPSDVRSTETKVTRTEWLKPHHLNYNDVDANILCLRVQWGGKRAAWVHFQFAHDPSLKEQEVDCAWDLMAVAT